MAEEYGIPLDVVESIAKVLGESEMFDGLISTLQDAEGRIAGNFIVVSGIN